MVGLTTVAVLFGKTNPNNPSNGYICIVVLNKEAEATIGLMSG